MGLGALDFPAGFKAGFAVKGEGDLFAGFALEEEATFATGFAAGLATGLATALAIGFEATLATGFAAGLVTDLAAGLAFVWAVDFLSGMMNPRQQYLRPPAKRGHARIKLRGIKQV
jgi:hypothetical protein